MNDQVLIQFRADKALKQEVSEIYESLGMDLPTAFRMFMCMSRMVKGIPFNVTIPQDVEPRRSALDAFARMRAQSYDMPEMSLDEINAEIASSRAQKKAAE